MNSVCSLPWGRQTMNMVLLWWTVGLIAQVDVSTGTVSGTGRTQARSPHPPPPAGSRTKNMSLECSKLQPGQYYCTPPDIDPKTQTAFNCSKETRMVQVKCLPVKGIYCNGKNHTGEDVGFYKQVPCKWTNGHSFSVAVLLSVFLGMFGVDRFYLGYPAIGLLKLCTLGFMFLGQLIDVLLIALQVVGPSDGSEYVIDYYGPGVTYIGQDNFTFIKPQY